MPYPMIETGGENLIIYGTPGCGKSHELAQRLEDKIPKDNRIRVTFHQDYTYTDFEDDMEEPEQEASEQTCEEKVDEWCPYCDTEVELEHELKVQRCPSCGHWIVPCSICPLTKCTKPCPLERLEMILNGESTF